MKDFLDSELIFSVFRATSTSARKCLGRGKGSGSGIASSADFIIFIFFLLGVVLVREELALGLELGVDAGLADVSDSSPELYVRRRFRLEMKGRLSSSTLETSTLCTKNKIDIANSICKHVWEKGALAQNLKL